MKKILVAVDGSTASVHAARKALELADALRAEVTLVHVEEPVVTAGEMAWMPDLPERQLLRGADILRELARAVERPMLKTVNKLGSPAEAIADLAEEGNFDLVVAGNKGRGAVARVLVGSVADRLVHICKVPVMVVR